MRAIDIERMRAYFHRKYFGAMAMMFRYQNKAFIDKVASNPDNAETIANECYKRDDTKKIFVSLYGEVGSKSAINTRNDFKKAAKQEIETKAVNDGNDWQSEFENRMRAYAVAEAGNRITSITGTSKEIALRKLRELMTRANVEGIGNDQLSQFLQDELAKELGYFERWRANMIVQTETVTAQNAGSMEGAKSLGLTLNKVWNTIPGVSQTERHAIMPGVNGQSRPMNAPFLIGEELLSYPGDSSGSAENVINCRCYLTYQEA